MQDLKVLLISVAKTLICLPRFDLPYLSCWFCVVGIESLVDVPPCPGDRTTLRRLQPDILAISLHPGSKK